MGENVEGICIGCELHNWVFEPAWIGSGMEQIGAMKTHRLKTEKQVKSIE